MNTKLVMTASAVSLAVAGIVLTFAPDEVAQSLGADSPTILLQLLGAAYFGFAMVNWTAKANLIGGIYARPIAIGNFSHFAIGAMALIKIANQSEGGFLIGLTIIYVVFAVLFGIILFRHPVKSNGAD